MNDLISIIVPVYNVAPFLQRSIGSIQNQTYQTLEVIAVDDGSTDDSLLTLESLAESDSRIRVIHQENSGVTSARLAGAAAARGEWIGFVDGDDEIEPDMYERLLQNALEYGADISHCGYQMVFPSRVDYYYNTGRIIRQDQRAGLKDLIDGSFIEPGLWNKLFHKSLFQGLFHSGKMDLSIKNMEDLLMNFYLFQNAKLSVYEDFCPYHYMVRKGSAATSKVNEHKLRDPLRVLKIIKNETADDTILQNAVNKRIAGCLVGLSTMKLDCQPELKRPYRDNARAELRQLLPELLHGNSSKKLKTMAVWAAVWPDSYCFAHQIHSKVSGNDRKYEVE